MTDVMDLYGVSGSHGGGARAMLDEASLGYAIGVHACALRDADPKVRKSVVGPARKPGSLLSVQAESPEAMCGCQPPEARKPLGCQAKSAGSLVYC